MMESLEAIKFMEEEKLYQEKKLLKMDFGKSQIQTRF